MSRQRKLIAVTLGLVAIGLGVDSETSIAQELEQPKLTQPNVEVAPIAIGDSDEVVPGEVQPAKALKKGSDREQRLAKYLTQSQFIGKFTIDGMEAPPKTETYTIKKCEKLPSADLYRLTARIKYGSTDQEVPLDLKILWSGNTPVITLDSLWIPSMGTFDARVMIRPGKDAGRYAGTWQHGDKGGHLFGKIVPIKADSAEEAANDTVEDASEGGTK